jgi:cation diffusion facilitator family transporter
MQDIKERVALTSIFASAGLTLAKGVVGVMTGSLAILSEAAHSLLDLAATIMTYFAVRISGQPADDEHHYGHGKVESVAALIETGLLFVLSGIVIWEATKRLLWYDGAVEATITAFAVIVMSIVVDFFRARLLYRVAGETSSEALEADALHFGSDMWSSLAVLAGLAGIFLGYGWADSAAALVVALFVCLAGWRLGRRTVDTLLDTAPAGVTERLIAIAQRVAGVASVERVRVRRVGKQLFVEMNILVSRTLPIDRVASVTEAVEGAVRAEMPDVEMSLTTEPRALDDETVLERVAVIARNRGLLVHHVTVHAIGEKLSVSLDLEVDGHMSLGAAHDIADRLEKAITEELGSDVEVETHIEPLQADDATGHDADSGKIEAIHSALNELIGHSTILRDAHDVRVRDTADGEIVNFHCYAEPAKTVRTVHEEVDELERALRRLFPSIKRVIGHAEPLTARIKDAHHAN